ncbi:MATE family efflux transporter [Aristaeella hokkaidonensis]|uniref:MATE family efflux transporter n=1 Tax=Aristaeella hokkaidonensis TaxID=3046382 RepID=A0AC61MWD5_9FIRM|nr:MATE family efflux transporter [Aristaeella hokkaidonensis]QUC67040.1 MATE family efflux transporter [Aristaeella hokkaidonensis]SNT93649.1 putative efflux protein, MATE family [Aristaeella hokkaidonensis]
MASVTGDFSKGKVSMVILKLGLPMMLAELVHVLYNIVDRMYIGHMPEGGTLALTGLGICFPLITLIGAFANLFSTGGATLATIARGAKEDRKAERIMGTSFTMLLLIGLLLTGLLYLTAPVTLRWLGGDDETIPTAMGYFRIYVLGTVSVLISLGMNPFISAQGFPKIGMGTILIGAILNIALDPLMIYTMNMGIRGAALATVVSQTASAIWVLGFLRSRRAVLRLTGLHLDWNELKRIVSLGVTGFTFRVTNSITQAIVNIMLKTWGGPLSTIYVGAMSLINSLREIMSLPNSGIVMGGQSVMSYNYGAKLYPRVSKSIRFIFLSGLFVNIVMWLLVMIVPEPLIRIFTSDEQLIRTAVVCARIYFGAFPFMAMQQAGQSTFVSLNYPRYALFFSLLRKIVLVAPLTLLLPNIGLGVHGVFWAEFASQVIGATACFTTMYRVIWRHLRKETNQLIR